MLPLLSLILLSSQVKVHGQSIDASTSVAWHYLPGSAFCEDTCKAWKFTGVPFRTGNNINADYEQPMYLCYAPFSNAPWVGWNGSVKLINTTSGFCWSAYSISDTTYTSSPTCLCMDSSFPVGPVYLSESPRPTSALVCSDACPSKQITINDAKYRATFSPLTVNYRFACAANGGNQGVRGGWVDIMYNGTTESRCITSVGLPTLHANPDYACVCVISTFQRTSITTSIISPPAAETAASKLGLSPGAVAGIGSGISSFVIGGLMFGLFALFTRKGSSNQLLSFY